MDTGQLLTHILSSNPSLTLIILTFLSLPLLILFYLQNKLTDEIKQMRLQQSKDLALLFQQAENFQNKVVDILTSLIIKDK